MKISKSCRIVIAFIMSFLMSNIASVAIATELSGKLSDQKMVSASDVLAEVTREQTEADVRNFMQNSNVKDELLKHGLTQEEISSRLANLSEREMRQLSIQVNEAKAGGDVLVTVVLVLLIIFLAKRI